MEKAQVNAFKEKIKSEIKLTEKKINEYSQLCKPIPPENSIGRVSRMDAINNKSVVEAALRVAKEKMNQLKVVQNKINQPDFGICNKCKQTIPFGRLMIQPHSRFCVICAQ